MKKLELSSLKDLSKSELVDLVTKLYKEIEDLEGVKNKNSQNSSKPPSSDGYEKPSPKSLRVRTGKSVGGQKGHTGSTLKQVSYPDIVKEYKVKACNKCGANLEAFVLVRHECRQEFDIIKPRSIVIEHRAEVKQCTNCLEISTATFPEHINSPVQYGNNVKTYSVYLNQYQFITFGRLQEMFNDCFNIKISQGSFVNFNKACSGKLLPYLNDIKNKIIANPISHFDETSLKINGKIHWLHVASTQDATYYDIHTKRGNIAMNTIGILPNIRGTAIHDYWKPYMNYYQCSHALCNAHHLRELEFIHERTKKTWAKQMINLLLRTNQIVSVYKLRGEKKLPNSAISCVEKRYDQIMKTFFKQTPIDFMPKSKRTKAEIKSENLGERFRMKRHLVLGFMYNFNIEFTNNLAEQDIRMTKVKSKISGSFRSDEGSKSFVKIRSYISTMRKNDQNILASLSNVFDSTLCNLHQV